MAPACVCYGVRTQVFTPWDYVYGGHEDGVNFETILTLDHFGTILAHECKQLQIKVSSISSTWVQ